MRCSFCIKELVLGYVNPDKDYKLCDTCAFRDTGNPYYPMNNIKNENISLDDLAKYIEILLNKNKTSAYEIKAYSNDVEVSFDWDYYYGNFTITLSKDGGYTVKNEYYVEKFVTVQQVADYLLKKDSDNGR